MYVYGYGGLPPVRSLSESGSESESESESIPASWTAQTSPPSGVSTATAVPGFLCPNPIRGHSIPETDSDPDPDLASPWTLLDGL
ncbi:MAG: hypothetical protein ACOX52_21210 [Verrucomicrobiota bacterium]